MGRRRRIALLALVGLAAWAGWRAIAIRGYRREGGRLADAAARFPRAYVVGKGRMRRIVILGDSTAVGVGADRTEETIPYQIALAQRERATILNLAVSGAKISDVVQGQLRFLPLDGADLALVSITANDATANTVLEDVRRDLGAILQRLTDLRITRIVVATTPNFHSTPALPLVANRILERRAAKMSQAIRDLAKEFPTVRVADLNERGTLTPSQYASDGFHPNADGYRRWASVFEAAAKDE